jgi:hypothetical protein
MNPQFTVPRLRAFIILSLVLCNDARAYVDPGSGMLLIQGLLALIGGVVFFLKNPLGALKSFWQRIRKSK